MRGRVPAPTIEALVETEIHSRPGFETVSYDLFTLCPPCDRSDGRQAHSDEPLRWARVNRTGGDGNVHRLAAHLAVHPVGSVGETPLKQVLVQDLQQVMGVLLSDNDVPVRDEVVGGQAELGQCLREIT